MKRNIFEPDDYPEEEALPEPIYEMAETDYPYPDDLVDLGEPDKAYFTLPGVYATGPTSKQIMVMTLFICSALAIGLLALVGKSAVQSVASASIAAGEVQAQETQLAAQPPAAQTAAAQASGDCLVSGLFPDKVTRWCGLITKYAAKHSLDPNLVAAVIWLESGGNETAFSRSGAVGLMQVMPSDGPSASFQCANGPCFSDRPTIAELNDPEFNISYGTRMLAGLVRKTGDIREALRSYGPMDAGYTYADKVLGIFKRYGK